MHQVINVVVTVKWSINHAYIHLKQHIDQVILRNGHVITVEKLEEQLNMMTRIK